MLKCDTFLKVPCVETELFAAESEALNEEAFKSQAAILEELFSPFSKEGKDKTRQVVKNKKRKKSSESTIPKAQK